MDYQELYQVYILENNEPVKVLETYDLAKARRTLNTQKRLGKKGVHIQYAFRDGGSIEQIDYKAQEWIDYLDALKYEPNNPSKERLKKYADILLTEYGIKYEPENIRYAKENEVLEKYIGHRNIITNKGLHLVLDIYKRNIERTLGISAYVNGEYVGGLGFSIDLKLGQLRVGGAEINEKFRRKGIYRAMIDVLVEIAKSNNLKFYRYGRSDMAQAFWKNYDPQENMQYKFGSLIESGKAHDYLEPGTREIAHLLKIGDQATLKEVALELSKQVNIDDVLVPMPSRHGCTTDNHALALSIEISKISGAVVYTGLCGSERPSLYEVKKEHQEPESIDLGLYLKEPIPEGANYWIVDNVIGTGYSMKNAIDVVGHKAKPLVYAVDSKSVKYKEGGTTEFPSDIIPVYDVINNEKTLNSLYHKDNLILKTGGSLGDKRNYRVRFHLGLGKNFMHWKIEEINPRKDFFYDPKEYQLVMSDCKLTNRPKTALKIFMGEMDKAPIAFIECRNISVIEGGDVIIPEVSERIFYNPRKSPYWLDEKGNIIDNSEFDVLFTYKTSVYVKVNEKTYEVGGWLDENGYSASHVATFKTGGKTEEKSTCEFTPVMAKNGNQILLFSEVNDLGITKENVREFLRKQTEERTSPQLTVLSFGGGQDSFAMLYLYLRDPEFRKRYAPKDFIVVMSDTGNEHPHTYKAIEKARRLCELNGIHFAFLTNDMGFHNPGWMSLKDNLKRNSTILSASMQRKSCTGSLKIQPLDKYVYKYICDKYGYPYQPHGKKSLALYEHQFRTKVRILIGFAKNEETRAYKSVIGFPKLPDVWKKKYFEYTYPLIEEGIDRQKAIDIIAENSKEVIYPSNCMICFYQSDVELVWLERFHPEEFEEWVEMERAKLEKFADREVNYGVYDKVTLTEKLRMAKLNSDKTMFGGKPYGEYSDEELWEYKLSHGHCVKSIY